MSDIPARLRKLADQIQVAMACDMAHDEDLMREAADKIEDLEDAIRALYRQITAVSEDMAFKEDPE